MQPGEQVVCEIKRHPIGIFGIYIAAGFILIVLAVLAFIIVPNTVGDSSNRSQIMALGGVAFIILAVLSTAFVFISNLVYWGNSWIVTSDSITQVSQTSLFSKQSAQLSLANLEDVTAEKNGILSHIFNYGVLKAETAGERSKFLFLYCPNPNYYAQKILAAREVFEQGHRASEQGSAQQPQDSPQPTAQSAPGFSQQYPPPAPISPYVPEPSSSGPNPAYPPQDYPPSGDYPQQPGDNPG